MPMQKFGDSEKFNVLRGEEANVLNTHRERLGKAAVSDFTEDEIKDLEKALTAAREKQEVPETEQPSSKNER